MTRPRNATSSPASAPRRFELLPLEDGEQRGLQREGQLADLVDEERAVFHGFEGAHAAFVRSGEGAFHVAKELARQQRLVEVAAIDVHERATGAVGEIVQRATTSLPVPDAFDEDGGVAARNLGVAITRMKVRVTRAGCG